MSKLTKKQSKFKIQRRLGELPGLGKPGATAKRDYPPGQHGQRRKRFTEYGIRLSEKQKVIYHYGLREQQLRRFVKMAKKGSSQNWIEQFFSLLETRLDNVVFRLGFAASLPAARQLVAHGNVFVKQPSKDGAENNAEFKAVRIPSALVEIGSEIKLADKIYNLDFYLKVKKTPRLELPSFLEKREEKKQDIGKLIDKPGSAHVPFELEKRFIAEFYTNVKP
ncbi:30S ribosomal protein S4 [Candidatus Marinamargulisbacteria bacterium SCGC AG-439-L15]|nr:30S ribosomal protein S4 [Candidatus Marinamargulisbacteria bacterium SCGC AG-439-L15]